MILEPILITGCARSGTSLVAGIINICGAFGGIMDGPNKNNEKGMFENGAIKREITKPFLSSIGVDPMGQFPLPDIFNLPNQPEWRGRILSILVNQGLMDDMKWFYKGAKMCLFWPIWDKAFPKAKWIIVRRDREEIIASCSKTNFMRAFESEKGWSWWVDQHLQRFSEMWHSGLNIREIWSRKIIDGDLSEIKEVIELIGLVWREKEVMDFISPELWHNRRENINGKSN